MREPPKRFGQMVISAVRGHKDACSHTQPCVVAVSPVAVQPPQKARTIVGSPTWRNATRAKEILDREANALSDIRAGFDAWHEAKSALVSSLRTISTDDTQQSVTLDYCCGATTSREDVQATSDDSLVADLKGHWRTYKRCEAKFDCAWARVKVMNADLLAQLTLRSGSLLDIFKRCECHDDCEDHHEETEAHDEPNLTEEWLRRDERADTFAKRAIDLADNAEKAASEAEEAAARAVTATRVAEAATDAVAQARNANTRRNAKNGARTAASKARDAAIAAHKAAAAASTKARRSRAGAGEATDLCVEVGEGPAYRRIANAGIEAEQAASRAEAAASRARNAAEDADAAAGKADQAAENADAPADDAQRAAGDNARDGGETPEPKAD